MSGGERYRAFPDAAQDDLLSIVLALGAEVWVLKDRLTLLEKALSRRGIDVSELIEEMARDAEHQAEIGSVRDAFLERLLRIPSLEVKA